MRRVLLIALVGAVLLPSVASAGSDRVGRRMDAIQSGRLYDPILTPQLNPGFEFNDRNAETMFLRDLRRGRLSLEQLPEGQRDYFRMQLDQTR